MKKTLLLLIAGLISLPNIIAQQLTVNHTALGDLENEIQTALTSAGATISSIETLIIISDNADLDFLPDLKYVRDNFKTTLKTIDLSQATLFGNKLNTSGSGATKGAFSDMTALKTVILPTGLTGIGAGSFSGSANLESVNLPDEVKIIEPYAFKGCSKLNLTSLPSSLITVSNFAFEGCEAMTLPVLPGTIQSMGEKAFYKCTAMTASVLPASMKTIGVQAFDECKNVTFSEWPTGITTIGKDAFRMTKATFTTWPANITTIINGVFVNTYGITDFVIPTEVTTIEQRAFYLSSATSRIFTCRAENPPSSVDVGAAGGLMPSFGPDPAASMITLNVLRKYASSFEGQTPWNKMAIKYLSHDIAVTVNNDAYGTVTTDYTHASLTSGTLASYEGDDVTFEILPASGYEISDVLLDGTSVKADIADNKLSIPAISEPHTLEVTFVEDSFVGINKEESKDVYVYPNPTSDVVKINGATDSLKTLFDTKGQLLIQTNNNEIDISTYSNGLYILKVDNKVYKVMKK